LHNDYKVTFRTLIARYQGVVIQEADDFQLERVIKSFNSTKYELLNSKLRPKNPPNRCFELSNLFLLR